MDNLHIQTRYTQQMATIPCAFFDIYMPEASGEFLKVYLYIYRWQNDNSKNMSLADIADRMYMTERDVMRALKYWQIKGLLELTLDSNDKLTGIILLPIADASGKNDTPKSFDQTVNNTVLHGTQNSMGTIPATTDYAKPQYSMAEIAEFSRKNQGEQLFFVLQQYIGHPLSQTEINAIVFFHEKLGFSTDLIEYLFEYCVGNNHRSIHYIEKVAISWAEEGIDTVSKAKGRSAYYSKTHYAVLKAFGITGRNPAKSEVDYINRWSDEYGFSPTLIIEACNRTMSATHSPSFEYADQILKNWKSQKVAHLNDVKALDESREKNKQSTENRSITNNRSYNSRKSSNRFNNFSQRVYDYSELEQKLARKIQTGSEH